MNSLSITRNALKRILFLIFLMVIVMNLSAQTKLLTVAQMQEDVSFYYEKLLETHPNPFQIQTPNQLEQYKNELLKSFSVPLSKEEFYRKISVLNQFMDPHTQIIDWLIVKDPKDEDFQHNKIDWDDKTTYPYQLFWFPKDSIALLELNTFLVTELGVNSIFDIHEAEVIYEKMLSQKMDSLVAIGCKHLFIDITANGGGSDNLAYKLLNYFKILVPRSYYIGKSDIKISNALRNLYSYIFSSKWEYLQIPFKKRYRQIFWGRKGKVIHQKHYIDYKSKSQIYSGNIYLIQSRWTYSAAISLCSFFKTYKVGIVIGEESGGKTSEYINSFPFTLPNSGYTFVCAVQFSEIVGSNRDGRGVMPDIYYKIENPQKSFTLEQLKEMLELVDSSTFNINNL